MDCSRNTPNGVDLLILRMGTWLYLPSGYVEFHPYFFGGAQSKDMNAIHQIKRRFLKGNRLEPP